jgi:hypothetical protein
MLITPLTIALLASAAQPEWVVFGRMMTDTFCTTAHDRVSGAVVGGCSTAPDGIDVPALLADRRLQTSREHLYGRASVLVLEYADPEFDIRRLREDIGPTPGCFLDQFLRAKTPSAICDRQMVFIALVADGRRRRFDMARCSVEQTERALTYVRDTVLGTGPPVIEKPAGAATQEVQPSDSSALLGASLPDVLAQYGPPADVWPHYPDGLQLTYPLAGSNGMGLILALDRSRHVRTTRAPCP